MNSSTKYGYWVCQQCGMVLGLIHRPDGHRTKLNVLKFGIPLENVKQMWLECEPVFSVLELEMGVVVCQKCGARREWRMSDKAIMVLLGERKLKKV